MNPIKIQLKRKSPNFVVVSENRVILGADSLNELLAISKKIKEKDKLKLSVYRKMGNS